MKTKTQKVLPKIMSGTVHKQFIRCGKSNCKCTRGEKHTAFYFFTRINGKLTKTHVRKHELEEFNEIVNKAKGERFERRRIKREAKKLISELRSNLREKQAIINLLRGQ
jgi:hypothetical protein